MALFIRTSPSYLGHQLQSAPGRCGCPVVAAAALLNSRTQLHAPHKACTCFSWVAPGKGDHCREMFVLVPCRFGAEAPSRMSATVDVSEASPPRMPMGTSLKLATYQHLVFRTRLQTSGTGTERLGRGGGNCSHQSLAGNLAAVGFWSKCLR